MGIGLKLVLAALSGCLVMLTFQWLIDAETPLAEVAMFGLCGGFFAAGVLLPYLKFRRNPIWRIGLLLIISGISFYFAIRTAADWASGWAGPNRESYLIASLVGASIVLLAAPPVLGLRYSPWYLSAGAAAAVIGGLLFDAVEGPYWISPFLSFGGWHACLCVALHIGQPSAAADSWLAQVARPRLYLVVGAFALAVATPFGDDGIGALLQRHYAARDGGLKLYAPVQAQGFRDQRDRPRTLGFGCGFACLTLLINGSYRFQEYDIGDANGRYLRFMIRKRPDPHCRDTGEDWQPPLQPIFDSLDSIDAQHCLTYRVSDKPEAEFAVREIRETVSAGSGLYPLTKTSRQIVRLRDDSLVSEAVYYQYDSRFFDDTYGSVPPWTEFMVQALPPADGISR